MKQQKSNKIVPRLLGLTMLLCIGLITVSAGTTFARYRAERREDVTFQVREPERILVGTVQDEVFTPSDQLVWTEENGVATLQFAVANGSSETSYSTRDQAVQLSMIGSLGLVKDGVLPDLSVTFIPQRGNGEEKTVKATVSSIVEGTALYHTYGAGWLYSFNESTTEGTQELTWELPGGGLTYITLTIKVEGETSDYLSLLQPLISAEPIGN